MIKSNLKEIMNKLNVTYAQLEQMTGLSSHTVTRARNDSISSCTLLTLELIANALNVQIKDLFEEED